MSMRCRGNGIRQAYIPMFLAGFAQADIVGTCQLLDDPAGLRRIRLRDIRHDVKIVSDRVSHANPGVTHQI
jgi:hypothetical protein